MNLSRRTLLSALALSPFAAAAQNGPGGYPSKPIKIIVGFAPGGGTDTAARMLAPGLSQIVGQPVFVENRAGAGGNIATEAAARSAPDGLTLVMLTTGQMITNPLAMKMSFSPEKEIVPLGRISAGPMILVVPANSPYKTARQFIAAAKAPNSRINYGSAGIGTVQHLGMETFKHAAGFEATHIPYKGSGPAVLDLISGKIDVILESTTASMAQIKGGTLRALAVTSEQPFSELPNVPTLNSLVPGVVVYSWSGIGAPAGISPELRAYLDDAVRRVVTEPSFAAKLLEQGSVANWLSSSDFTKAIAAERTAIADLIKRANLKLEN